MNSMNNKLVQIEKMGLKANLVATGVPQHPGENCKQAAIMFLWDMLKTKEKIEIQMAYKLGGKDKEKRPLLIQLFDPSNQAIVYRHTKNLKGIWNVEGEYYFMNDYLPEKLSEEQHKKKEKIKINNLLIDAHQQTLEWKKGSS